MNKEYLIKVINKEMSITSRPSIPFTDGFYMKVRWYQARFADVHWKLAKKDERFFEEQRINLPSEVTEYTPQLIANVAFGAEESPTEPLQRAYTNIHSQVTTLLEKINIEKVMSHLKDDKTRNEIIEALEECGGDVEGAVLFLS